MAGEQFPLGEPLIRSKPIPIQGRRVRTTQDGTVRVHDLHTARYQYGCSWLVTDAEYQSVCDHYKEQNSQRPIAGFNLLFDGVQKFVVYRAAITPSYVTAGRQLIQTVFVDQI